MPKFNPNPHLEKRIVHKPLIPQHIQKITDCTKAELSAAALTKPTGETAIF